MNLKKIINNYFTEIWFDEMEKAMNINVRAYRMSGYYKSKRFYLNNVKFLFIKYLAGKISWQEFKVEVKKQYEDFKKLKEKRGK